MESKKVKQYAEMLMAMSTDYLMGNYDEELYKSIVITAAKAINK